MTDPKPPVTHELDRYEVEASLFRAATGLMAPGKDEPMAMNSVHTQEERRAAWDSWISTRAFVDALDRIIRLEAAAERSAEETDDLRAKLQAMEQNGETVADQYERLEAKLLDVAAERDGLRAKLQAAEQDRDRYLRALDEQNGDCADCLTRERFHVLAVASAQAEREAAEKRAEEAERENAELRRRLDALP
jgi:chromosome segregation ATPase